MANLTYYSFNKRSKSTKQPAGGGTTIDVKLKGGTDLLSPTFILDWPAGSIPTFNYVFFENRYYFVKNIINETSYRYQIVCEEDYLATHKTELATTPVQILYATGGRDDIMDKRIPTGSNIHVSSVSTPIPGFTIIDEAMGPIVLSVTGTGSFGTYLMSQGSQLPELLKNADLFWNLNVPDILTAEKQKWLSGSAPDCIKGAISLPFTPRSSSLGANEQLFLGGYPCTDNDGNAIEVLEITNPICKYDCELNIPWRYNDWRRHSPYSNLVIYLPFFGLQQLPVDDLVNDNKIFVDYSANITSGDISYQIQGVTSSRVVATGSTNCAIQTPYGSANINVGKVASSIAPAIGAIAGVAAGAVTGGAGYLAIGAGLAASAATIGTALSGETKGGGGLGGGSSQGLDKAVRLSCISRELTDSQSSLNPLIGKPVMKKDIIGNYSGFVQTGDMMVAGDMLDAEREMINSLCDGGFYYE